MEKLPLVNLKLQIEYLLHSRTQLAEENKMLRQRLIKMIQRQAFLLDKKQTICKKLRTLTAKIKEELI